MRSRTMTSPGATTYRRWGRGVLGLVSLLLASGALCAPVLAQPDASPWTDRMLATVPRDGGAKTVQWDSWVAINDDLAHVAYLLRYPSGDRLRETYVLDGQRGPELVFASRAVLSTDGRHLAYIGIPEEPGLPAYLMLGPVRIRIQFKDNRLGPTWFPVFSPDGRKVAFRAERPGGKYAIGVLDVDAALAEPTAAERRVVWGPEFLDMDRPTWSPDSSVVGYAACSGNEWAVVVGTSVHATWKDATGVTFTRSGEVAYHATDGTAHFIVMGAQRQASFSAVTSPALRPDGTLVYGASQGNRHYVTVGTRTHEVPHAVDGAAASTDGTRVMWWYWGDKRERLVINGEQGRKFRRATSPALHPDAGTWAYTAEDDRHFYVVTPLGVHAYDGVLWMPRISPDGSKVGFVALIGTQLHWKVLPLR